MDLKVLLKGWLLPAAFLCALCVLGGAFLTMPAGTAAGEPEEPVSVTGTWVDAGAWENGDHSGVLIEFTPEGVLRVNGFETCSYRCGNGEVYLVSRGAGRVTKCSVTGDYLSVQEYTGGVGLPRSANDFVRISDSVGIPEEQISELY